MSQKHLLKKIKRDKFPLNLIYNFQTIFAFYYMINFSLHEVTVLIILDNFKSFGKVKNEITHFFFIVMEINSNQTAL